MIKHYFIWNFFKILLDKLGAAETEELEDGKIKFNGTWSSKITARAFARVPIQSLVFLGLLEIPSICKAKDKTKQAKKVTFNIVSTAILSGFIGAGLAYFRILPSLIGIFLGSWIASKLTKHIFSSNLSQ